MMATLLDMTVRGSLVILLVLALDGLLARRMRASWRRLWWVLAAGAFLIPWRMAVLPAEALPEVAGAVRQWTATPVVAEAKISTAATNEALPSVHVFNWTWLWLGGAGFYMSLVVGQTIVAARRWSRERLSTDSALLELLEDGKATAGITAPIGLVISDRATAPALLGWLRPRILLPRELAQSMPREQLRLVLLHELAHFRSLDIPLGWFFTLVRAVHWFNPLAHLAFAGWVRFREEEADEAAIGWSQETSGATYGEALLCALRFCNGRSAPFGALTIGESIHNLKRRMTMIPHYCEKSTSALLACAVGVCIAGLSVVSFARAQSPATAPATNAFTPDDAEKKAAVQAMEEWLRGIDAGKYAESREVASAYFKSKVSTAEWVAALNSVRKGQGACTARKLASAALQVDIPYNKKVIKGTFVIAQFESSFENMKYVRETVTFEKEADGVWRASGYYIAPR